MVTRSRLVVFSLMILGVVSLSACMRPAPGPMHPESAAIGVMLEKQWSKGGLVEYAERVYFVRWNDSDDPTAQNDIIESNFSHGNRTYLLNAKPGRYSAVAASDYTALKKARKSTLTAKSDARRQPSMPLGAVGLYAALSGMEGRAPGRIAATLNDPGGPFAAVNNPVGATAHTTMDAAAWAPGPARGNGFAGVLAGAAILQAREPALLAQTFDAAEPEGDRLDDYQAYTTYFSEELVRKTVVEVGPGDFAVMGSFQVLMENNIRYADKVQDYYYRTIHPFVSDLYGMPFVDPDNSFASRAHLLKERKGREVERELLEKALDDLRGTPWVPLVRRKLEALR